MRARGAPLLIAALVAGFVQAASFAPVEAWWLQLASLAALVAMLLRVPARATAIGFAFGLGCFGAGVSWLYVSMHRYGGMPAPLAALALLLFAAYLAAFVALVAALFARVDCALRARETRLALRAAALGLLFPGAWALAEIARGWLFTGFPWLAIGYAHVDGPLASFAPLLGVYGVCALAALAAFGVALALAGLRTHEARAAASTPAGVRALGVLAALAPLLGGLALAPLDWSTVHAAPLRVRLLQGNVPQELKFDPQRSRAALQAYTLDILRGDAPLTVLPETAWTIPWSATPAPLRDAIAAHLERIDGVVAIGMPLFAGIDDEDPAATQPASASPARYPMLTNSVAVIDASGHLVSRYDKRHLVPFGEFVPFGFGWFVDLMHIPLGDFARGADTQAPLAIAGQRVAFDICYEDLFGEEIGAQVRGGATILVNVSNIAWFGDSHALPQHLQIARMRAIEFARPMLRATNTGVTAAIDGRGRVLERLPTHAAGALEIDVQGLDGLTPYARFGNAPVLALSLVVVAAGGWVSRRGARAARRATDQTR